VHPDARLALDYGSPFELLIALILAAQCTDERVNDLTRTVVFDKYTTPQDYLRVTPAELEADIRPSGFYRNKARAIQRCCQHLVERFGGQVPDTSRRSPRYPALGARRPTSCWATRLGSRQSVSTPTSCGCRSAWA
jgi:endonuclease-3